MELGQMQKNSLSCIYTWHQNYSALVAMITYFIL